MARELNGLPLNPFPTDPIFVVEYSVRRKRILAKTDSVKKVLEHLNNLYGLDFVPFKCARTEKWQDIYVITLT